MVKKAEQYFTSQPTSTHDFHTIHFDFAGKQLVFQTDAGVFSKSRIDYGTVVLLSAVHDYFAEIPAGKILDLGTGYGPVGVAIKAIDQTEDVVMVDVNQRSLALAEENLAANHYQAQILQSNIYENITDQFAAIIVNPPIRAGKEVVTKMLIEARKQLVTGGMIFAVLQKKQGAPSAEKHLRDAFGNVEILKRDKGYYVLRSIRN